MKLDIKSRLKSIKDFFNFDAKNKGKELVKAIESFRRDKPDAELEARIVKLVTSGARTDTLTIDGMSPLAAAAYKGINSAIPALIAAGADKEAKSTDRSMIPGLTPLMWAAYSGNTAGAEQLIKAGADVKAKGYADKTALHFSARTNVATIDLLIKSGADVNALSGDGRSPLFEAVLDSTKIDNVKRILAENPSLDSKDNWSNWTLLDAAGKHGGKDNAVVKLIKAEIDKRAAAPKVETPAREVPVAAPVAVVVPAAAPVVTPVAPKPAN